jgi:hypothetical protein
MKAWAYEKPRVVRMDDTGGQGDWMVAANAILNVNAVANVHAVANTHLAANLNSIVTFTFTWNWNVNSSANYTPKNSPPPSPQGPDVA